MTAWLWGTMYQMWEEISVYQLISLIHWGHRTHRVGLSGRVVSCHQRLVNGSHDHQLTPRPDTGNVEYALTNEVAICVSRWCLGQRKQQWTGLLPHSSVHPTLQTTFGVHLRSFGCTMTTSMGCDHPTAKVATVGIWSFHHYHNAIISIVMFIMDPVGPMIQYNIQITSIATLLRHIVKFSARHSVISSYRQTGWLWWAGSLWWFNKTNIFYTEFVLTINSSNCRLFILPCLSVWDTTSNVTNVHYLANSCWNYIHMLVLLLPVFNDIVHIYKRNVKHTHGKNHCRL